MSLTVGMFNRLLCGTGVQGQLVWEARMQIHIKNVDYVQDQVAALVPKTMSLDFRQSLNILSQRCKALISGLTWSADGSCLQAITEVPPAGFIPGQGTYASWGAALQGQFPENRDGRPTNKEARSVFLVQLGFCVATLERLAPFSVSRGRNSS